MPILDKKVEALIRFALAQDSAGRVQAQNELRNLAEGDVVYHAREEIVSFLSELDIPVGPKGYDQLVTTLELAIEEPRLLNDLQNGLYTRAAELCGTPGRRIERNIRHCIEAAWEIADTKVLNSYFANVISHRTGKPSTGAFLTRCVREIRRRLGR